MSRRLIVAALALAACAATAQPVASASDRYGFELDIVLSPKAAATLTAQHEGLYLFASYYGNPKPEAAKQADEVGHIDLVRGTVGHTIAGRSGPVHFAGPTMAPERLAMIAGPVMVNLNVASARKSGADNLLDCDFIDGPLAAVRKARVTLHCGLIGEHPHTAQKP